METTNQLTIKQLPPQHQYTHYPNILSKMYKIKLLTNVSVINHTSQQACTFEKDLQLPFIPFQGLTIQLNEQMEDDFTVEEIRYCVQNDLFYLDAEDVQNNTAANASFLFKGGILLANMPSQACESDMREIVEHYQNHGWTLLEGDEKGPFYL